jgi:enamine deaminase RidA (YjgF/YER057c/UK114 family)
VLGIICNLSARKGRNSSGYKTSKAAVGDLDNVRRIVKDFVMVNGAPNFTEPHRVADGASELLVQVFGERGIHARSAVSVAQVPFGACVEIDMIAELRATQAGGSI